MKKNFFILFLFVGLIVIITGIYGFLLLRNRAGIPSELNIDSIIQVNETKIESEKDFEYILSKKKIGQKALFFMEVDGNVEKKELRLIPFYKKTPYPLIYLIIGLFCLSIGVIVLLLKRTEKNAVLFY